MALARAPDGVTEVVKVGHGVGADLRVVNEVTRDYIKLAEAEMDCAGEELRERDNYLPRAGAAVKAGFSMIVGPSEVHGGLNWLVMPNGKFKVHDTVGDVC